MSLRDALTAYVQSQALPMHMPGHKRNADAFPFLEGLGASLDITEIEGFDNLHHPTGWLRQCEEQAAALWEADRSFLLVNGSTCGILAGLRAIAEQLPPKSEVLVARNCHRSVFNAIALCGWTPRYLLPSVVTPNQIGGSLIKEDLQAALNAYPHVRLLVITSPSYEGVLSDLPALCQMAHERNILVFVDEAHGAHLGFSPKFPISALQSGADLVVQSLHKTLPSLTQTALLHLGSKRIPAQAVARQLSVFETSSPSYLLLQSIDGCIRYLKKNRHQAFAQWSAALESFDQRIRSLRALHVWGHGAEAEKTLPVFALDPSKLLISTHGTSLTGPQLMNRLRREYHIELEMAQSHYVLAMTGMGDTEKTLSRLAEALCDIDTSLPPRQESPATPFLWSLPQMMCPPADIFGKPCRLFSLAECLGRTAAEAVWAYPPGIPFIVPGERVEETFLVQLAQNQKSGVSLYSEQGALPQRLCCLSESY